MADPQRKPRGHPTVMTLEPMTPLFTALPAAQGPHELPPCVHLFLVLTATEGVSPLDLNLNFFVLELFVVHEAMMCFSMSRLKVHVAQGHLVCSRCAGTSSLVV